MTTTRDRGGALRAGEARMLLLRNISELANYLHNPNTYFDRTPRWCARKYVTWPFFIFVVSYLASSMERDNLFDRRPSDVISCSTNEHKS